MRLLCNIPLRRTVFLLLLLVAVPYLKAQDIQVKYLGIENGLSNNAVNTIFQDHNGFMWFGTYDGLNRYDGYGFKVFRNIIGDSNSISSNNINAIEEDAGHRLWVCGQKEVNIYNPVSGRFSTPSYTFYNGTTRSSLKDNVFAVQVINGNKILAGTQHNGLFCFDNTNNGKQVPLEVNGKKLVDYYVPAIAYDKTKNLTYIFVADHGLYIYDAEKNSLRLKTNALGTANCLKVSRTGKLWLGHNTGVYFLNEATNSFTKSVFAGKAPIVNLCEDKNGVLWIASDGDGIWLMPPGKNIAEPFTTGAGNEKPLIHSNAVYAIYEDKQERKWIGTLRGGINIIEPESSLFKKIVYKASGNDNSINNFIFSFCEDAPGKVWIGTDGAGLRYWNRADNSYRNFVHDGKNNSISSNFITSIIQDAHKNIWVATWFGGINRFDRATQSFKQYTCFNPKTNGSSNNIWLLIEDSRQRIWASAVRNGGLFRYNPTADRFNCVDSSLTDLQSLAEDADGDIWGGDYTSLIKIDTINKKHRFYNVGFTVRCIHPDKQKNLWIGTQEGGLLLFNKANGTFKRYTTADGLPNNTILRMLEDKQGYLWFSTYNGISKFDVQKKTFRNFSQSDGLQSNQFSFNGALALSTGEFFFGGIKGFNAFYPDSINSKKQTPPLFLTDCKIYNTTPDEYQGFVKERNFEQVKKIVVPYNKAILALDFLGLDYTDAAEINYAYYLDGWDKDWNYVNHTRTANYSRLQEGDYFFKVKTSNAEGVWGNAQTLLQITVLPPWYRTWWAYCLYGLCCVSAIYMYSLYKSKQAKLQYQIQLAHLETQKEKELNEKKIAFFTNMSHEFRTPLSLIINPIKDLLHKTESRTESAELKVIYRNARRLLRLVDQLLLFKRADAETDKLNIVHVNFYNICNDVFSCFTERAKSGKIKYELKGDAGKLMLNVDREKIEIALFNILSNAFKYTPDGGEIIFKTEELDSQIKISISDTGPGIPAAEAANVFERFYQAKEDGESKTGFGIGLYLVKKFIEAHNGQVTFTSREGKGTTFNILLNKPITSEKDIPAPASEPELTGTEALTDGHLNKNPDAPHVSAILNEMNDDEEEMEEDPHDEEPAIPQDLITGKQTLLIIDDDNDIRNYLVSIFNTQYKIYQADNGKDGVQLAREQLPDLIISDVVMKGVNGIDLCKQLKEDTTVSHIPIILLTGSSSDEMQLIAMNSGADDFIKKPFDKDILVARVNSILNRRNVLQNYFYNEITLGTGKFKVSAEYRDFLQQCMKIIEDHLFDDNFSIKVLASEIGMSHSNLYKKIKAVSGQSVNSFIRFIRLKKAAEILISTENNVNETANMVGFSNTKYFRIQFFKLFGLNPSDYIKKYRKSFHNNQTLEDKVRKS